MTTKKKIILSLCSSVVLIGIFLYVSNRPKQMTNFPPRAGIVVAFGDSLTQGVGATNSNDFPSILQSSIGESVVNMGVPGDTSAQGLARIEDIEKQNPKVVLVLFGGNDFLRKVPIQETFKNIDDIVVRLQKNGAVVILIGIRGGILSDKYEKHYREISKNRGTFYVPSILEGIISNGNLMSDAIHPNNAGYKIMAEKILPVLRKALNQN